MQSQNRVLDDLARVATSALGVATGVRQEMEARMREQFEKVLLRMDLVSREEFEVVQAMARKAREEQAGAEDRLASLEARLAALESAGGAGAKTARPAAKTAKASSGKSAAGKTASDQES